MPLNFRLTGAEAAYILQDSGARAVVVDEFGTAIIEAASEQVGTIDVIATGIDARPYEDYAAVLAAGPALRDPVDIPEGRPAPIMYTSGTTGRPVATVAARIVDPEMNDVAPGEVGEIVYRGPGLIEGY